MNNIKYLKIFLPNSIVFTTEQNSTEIIRVFGKVNIKSKTEKTNKQTNKQNLNLKGIKSQLKSLKGTDVSCLLRLGLLLLINRASEIFLLNLCLYPELTIVKSSRVTRA